jgi:hypothetical protein
LRTGNAIIGDKSGPDLDGVVGDVKAGTDLLFGEERVQFTTVGGKTLHKVVTD